MKKIPQKIILSIIGTILLGLAFAGGMYYAEQGKPIGTDGAPIGEASGTKTYVNHRLHYSLTYSAQLSVVEERGDSVTFKATPEEPWGFGVTTEKTTYATTEDWLDAQPKGNASTAGYQPVFWIDGAPYGKLIVAEYVVVDYDGKKPIYGKILSAVLIQNGMLYKIAYKNQFVENETPAIGSDMLDVINSFQAFIE